MSIIQTIREKGAKISVVLIALALLGFILTDYFAGKGRSQGGGNTSTSVGSVNGKSINADEFQKNVTRYEQNMVQQGYPQSAAAQQAIEQAWSQEVNKVLLSAEFDKLGLQITKKELGDILYGKNAPQDLQRQFTDEATGQYNAAKAKQTIDQMLKDKNTPAAQKEQFNVYVEELEQQRKSEKYGSLLSNSSNLPRWFAEKQTADNAQIAKISLVRESYSTIPDSTVKIEEKEIANYISKHKDDFKQEESRSVAYVTFSAAPSVADSVAVRNQLQLLKPGFDTTTDVNSFLARNGSPAPFDGYIGASQMQFAAKDTIQKLGINQVFGPYLDDKAYTLAKMLDIKTLPDSVKCRHILLGTQDRSGNPIMPDSVAKKKVDSIEMAIKNGANFDTLNMKYSTDEAAKTTKGVMTFSSASIQGEGFAKAFGQFILFDGKPGDKKVVKTEFGWHYIEILAFIKPQPSYKVAYLTQDIVPSQETDNNALNKANQFAAESRDEKSFDATVEKLKSQGVVKTFGLNIRPNDAQVQGLSSRQLVKDIYEAKRGEVLKPVKINDEYVVAVVTEVFKEGTKSVATARPMVEPILRNEKKAEIMKTKIGKVTTLEDAAAKMGGRPIEPMDSLRMSLKTTSSLGYEPRIIGAAFNPSNKGKVVPEVLAGINGVYVVRVENVSATPVSDINVADQRKGFYEQSKQSPSNNPLNALRKAATIKDKRSNRY